ncbi:MAG: GNAT family protein, partial [Gordonia amarae]
PDHSPFATPWTDGDPVTVARSVFASLMAAMRMRAEPDGPWALKFVLFDRIAGPVGVMDLRQRAEARDEVVTGSWLLRSHHGQGLGTQARAAVLKLAFEALGVREARTAAYVYNAASLGVTRKLGYTQIGVEARAVRGLPAESLAFSVDHPRWAASPAATALNPHISWTGLDAVADLLGTGVRTA